MAIREEDSEYETRVFQVSIPELNLSKLQMCIGRKYEHEGKDRYNVYEVVNARVSGTIGYYTVESGTDVIDHTDSEKPNDFDVKTFGVPDFTDEFKQRIKGEKKKIKAPEGLSTKFKIMDTTTGGDCFYDSVVRAETGELDTFNKEAVQELRNKLADYIRDNNKDDIISFYKEFQQSTTATKSETSLDLKHYGKDYFNNDYKVPDDEIVNVFSKNMKTMGVWVNDLIINAYERMANKKLLLLESSSGPVETHEIHPVPTLFVPNGSTNFIMLDYEPMKHFKVIVKDSQALFSWDQVPSFIKDKFKEVDWYKKMEEPEVHAAEAPLEAEPEVNESDAESEYEVKPDIVEEIMPEVTEATKEVTKEATPETTKEVTPEPTKEATPEAAKEATKEPTPKEPTQTKKKTLKLKPELEMTEESLNKLSVAVLQEMAKEKCPKIAVSGKPKSFLITCILNPTNAECNTKKKGGFTRKNK